MSGVLRRGSLNFDCVGTTSSRGSLDANLYGGYRETKPTPGTPEISVIAMDFRRLSDDLKKVGLMPLPHATALTQSKDLSQDDNSDVLSNFLGHYRRWSFVWTFLLSLFQIPTTFHLFMFVFQVSFQCFCYGFFFYGLANIYTLDCVALSKPNFSVCLLLYFVSNKNEKQ